MDTLQCETLAAAADPLTQEIDLIEEAVSPYMRVLSEIACKGKVANATGVPHAITLADHGDAHKMIETSGLRRSTTEDVVEWMQREVWNVVKRNVECVISDAHNIPEVSSSYSREFRSYHGVPGQLLQERPASFLQRQTVIWTDLDLGSIDTFILFSHALIFFESLTCCISCAVSTEPVNEICEPNDNLERINMLWDACIYLAAMALAHWETREGPNAAHAHFEHNIWEAL